MDHVRLAVFAVSLALATAGLVAALPGGPVARAQGGGAVVVKGEGCGVLDSDGGFVLDLGAKILSVRTPSGNDLVTCAGQVTPPADGKAIVFKIGCTSFGEFTANAQETIAPNGRYHLECRFNPSGQ